jgi:hypothetical protein
MSARLNLPQERGKLWDILRPEDNIDMRDALKDTVPLLLGHTATDANDKVRVLTLEPLQVSKLTVDLLLGLVTDATGIEQDEISPACFIGDLIAETDQNARDTL